LEQLEHNKQAVAGRQTSTGNGNGWFICFLYSILIDMGSLQAFRRTNAAIISSPQTGLGYQTG